MKDEIAVIARDYEYNPDIMNDEPERLRVVKYIINNRLSDYSRDLMLLYLSVGSYRKLGDLLDVSHSSIELEIIRIKQQIKNELKNE